MIILFIILSIRSLWIIFPILKIKIKMLKLPLLDETCSYKESNFKKPTSQFYISKHIPVIQ